MKYSILKKAIEENNFTINSISDKIGMTAQGLSAAIKNDTLKIRDLEKIAEILKMNICDFFDEKKAEKNVQIAQNINGNNHQSVSDCEKENAHLRELLAEKERLIQVLMNK